MLHPHPSASSFYILTPSLFSFNIITPHNQWIIPHPHPSFHIRYCTASSHDLLSPRPYSFLIISHPQFSSSPYTTASFLKSNLHIPLIRHTFLSFPLSLVLKFRGPFIGLKHVCLKNFQVPEDRKHGLFFNFSFFIRKFFLFLTKKILGG